VHDRTIDGQVYVFGNAGGLYKNAMTWWDHTTNSIWSQPTGEALSGPLEATRLEPLPFQLTTWENWLAAHPETLVMSNDADRISPFRQQFKDDFLIGVTIGDLARGYPYPLAAEERLIEDRLGEFPILIWAAEEDYRVFLRQVDDQVLDFEWQEGMLVDEQTGSRWDPRLGLAKEGPYKGQTLQQIPSLTIYQSSWDDFYPGGEIYRR
jgi:hypothetical protein